MKIFKTLITLSILITSFTANADLSDSSLVPKEEMNFAKEYLGEIRNRNFEYILSYVDPEISNQVSLEKLEGLANIFPKGELLSTELIGSHVNTINSTWQGNFTFEYQFEGGWAVANTALKRINEKTTVIGFSVYQTPASQKELNKFELLGKSLLHYIVLVSACIIPLFIIVSQWEKINCTFY